MTSIPSVGSMWSFDNWPVKPTLFFEGDNYVPTYDGIVLILGPCTNTVTPFPRITVLANGQVGSIALTWFSDTQKSERIV